MKRPNGVNRGSAGKAPSPVRILALVPILALFAVGCAKPRPRVAVEPPPPDARAVFVDSVWLTPDRARAIAANDMIAAAWFQAQAAQAVAGVFVHVDETTDRFAFHALASGARAANLRVVAAVPLFLGAPPDGAAPVRIDSAPADANGIPRRSPVSPEARIEALRRVRAAATLDVDAVCFTHAGFASAAFDFSEEARFAFESALRRSISAWPGDVASAAADGAIARGPLWDRWTVWRSGIVRDFLVAARAEADEARADAGLPRVPVALMANGYYPTHPAEGVNWADAGTPAGDAWSEAPRGYEGTAAGQAFDAVVLEAFAPFASAADARDAGMEWWASAEGALAVARRATARPVMLAVAPSAWAGDDATVSPDEETRWRAALAGMRRLGVPLLLVE